MSTRRLLRMMAGDIKSPGERAADRLMRRARRDQAAGLYYATLIEKILRREKGDPDLPPMPLDFKELERRAREGK